MTRKVLTNIAASVRARLLNVSKERREDFTLTLMNYAAERFLYPPTETIIAEKLNAMVERGISNSRMKDFADVAMAARRIAFDGGVLVSAIRATFLRRGTPLSDGEVVALTDKFVQDTNAQANWKAFARRSRLTDFDSLAQVVSEARRFLHVPLQHARSGAPFNSRWNPGGPWT